MLACVTPTVSEVSRSADGAVDVYRHERLGYRIGVPVVGATPSVASGAADSPRADGEGERSRVRWDRVDIEGADLAFRRVAGRGETTMIVASRCGAGHAPLRVLARHLLFGIGPREVRESGPAVVAGGPAWVQWADAGPPESAIHIKTVTARLDGCLVDWVLASSDDFDAAVPEFDRWWASFERPVRSARSAEGKG